MEEEIELAPWRKSDSIKLFTVRTSSVWNITQIFNHFNLYYTCPAVEGTGMDLFALRGYI